MEQAKRLPEHDWLQQAVGDWTYECEAFMGPDKPAEKMAGTEHVRSIGGLWIVAEGRGKDPGGEDATMMLTIGFDPELKRFVGTWFGSMMTRLWVYDIAREGDSLHMESDGPSFTDPGKVVRYRDTFTIVSRDERLFTGAARNDDGSWTQFMTMRYRRA